jgi:hypothetical protein
MESSENWLARIWKETGRMKLELMARLVALLHEAGAASGGPTVSRMFAEEVTKRSHLRLLKFCTRLTPQVSN